MKPALRTDRGQESEWIAQNARKAWLGREGSNLRMAESKSAALPLGYAPMPPFCGAARIHIIRHPHVSNPNKMTP